MFRTSILHVEKLLEPDDREVLMTIYRKCGGPEWEKKHGWGTTAPLEEWFGVDVMDGRVVELDLGTNNVCGKCEPKMSYLIRTRNHGTLLTSVPSSSDLQNVHFEPAAKEIHINRACQP